MTNFCSYCNQEYVGGFISHRWVCPEKNKITKYCVTRKKILAKPKPLKQYLLSPSLAYVFGVMDGDGCAYTSKRSGFYLRLNAMDEDFCREFGKQLKIAEPNCSPYLRKLKNKRRGWISIISNKSLYYAYQNFDNNTLINYPDDIKAMYLRGFADSEGSVCKTNHTLIISNTNRDLTMIVKSLLEQLNIFPTVIINKKTNPKHNVCYHIRISGRYNIFRYRDIIGFSIRRKMQALDIRCSSYDNAPKSHLPEVYDEAIKLSEHGLSVNEIADRLSVNRGTMYGWIIEKSQPLTVKNRTNGRWPH